MRKLRGRLAFLILITFLFTFTLNIPALPAVIKLQPRIVLKPVTSTIPKIVMNRVPLDSPKGMAVYQTKTLPVRNDLVQKYGNPTAVKLSTTGANQVTNVEKQVDVQRLVVNNTRGHMTLLPDLEQLSKVKAALVTKPVALNNALKFVNDLKLVPQDISKLNAKQVVTLSKSDIQQGQKAVTNDILQTVIFQRTINNKIVVDSGSQLSVELGDKGQMVGFNRTWNQLSATTLKPVYRNNIEVYTDIENQLKQQFRGAAEIRVSKPNLIYFGNDQKYVQPAYFYSAQITNPKSVDKIYFAGVVSALKNPPEQISMFSAVNTKVGPQIPEQKARAASYGSNYNPSIGRYVVRNDYWDWVDDANDFKNGLLSGHPSSYPPLTFGDYYWDEPRFWTSQEDYYVDKWNTVLMEGHGANWLFTTKSNNADIVNLNSASQPGYGDRVGDSMRYLILKGCSIIPSPQDRANWPDAWWRIFKGLRQAIGSRTTMYINDDISGHFGQHLAQNSRILDSWFHATNSCPSYQWNRFWGAEVTGYGCIVMIPGHEGDTIYQTTAAPPATSTGLVVWWQH